MTSLERQIALAQITVFSTFASIIFCCMRWHGTKGLLGWAFLLSFCILRIVGASVFLGNPSSEAGVIVSSVAVSPLILSTMALGYESASSIRRKLPWPLQAPMQIILHILVSIGITLSIIGGVHFDIQNPSSTDQNTLVKLQVGSAIFMIVWLILIGITALSCRYHRADRGENLLLVGVLLASPFLGVRVGYSLLSVAVNSSYLNIVPSDMVFKVILSVVPEMAITAIFALIGIKIVLMHC